MGDRGQALNVGTEHPFERASLGRTQFWELGRNVRNRAVVLAELHTSRGSLRGRSVSVRGEGLGQRLGAFGVRGTRVDVGGQRFGQRLGPVLGEGHDGVLSPVLTQIAQRGGGEIVVGVRERRASLVGDGVRPGRTAAATTHDTAWLALDQVAVVDECIEVPADRGGRQAQLVGQCCRALRPALEHEPGNGVASTVGTAAQRAAFGVVLDFHYTSMTYFPRTAQATPADTQETALGPAMCWAESSVCAGSQQNQVL
jgi:hypothetical protein